MNDQTKTENENEVIISPSLLNGGLADKPEQKYACMNDVGDCQHRNPLWGTCGECNRIDDPITLTGSP